MRKKNIAIGAVFLVLAITAYIMADQLKINLANDNIGPALWPKTICVAMGFVAVLQIVTAALKKDPQQEPLSDDERKEREKGYFRVFRICLVMIAFGAVLYFFGMYVGILFMTPLTMYLYGERRPPLLIGIPVFMTIFIYVVFKILLRVPLPLGRLFT